MLLSTWKNSRSVWLDVSDAGVVTPSFDNNFFVLENPAMKFYPGSDYPVRDDLAEAREALVYNASRWQQKHEKPESLVFPI